MAEQSPRRRRRMRHEPDSEAAPSPAMLAAMTSPVHDPEEVAEEPEERESERGLRGLVGGGSSQVRVGAAMRARDATRPSAEDLAAAAADLVIVRRGWTPPTSR